MLRMGLSQLNLIIYCQSVFLPIIHQKSGNSERHPSNTAVTWVLWIKIKKKWFNWPGKLLLTTQRLSYSQKQHSQGNSIPLSIFSLFFFFKQHRTCEKFLPNTII